MKIKQEEFEVRAVVDFSKLDPSFEMVQAFVCAADPTHLAVAIYDGCLDVVIQQCGIGDIVHALLQIEDKSLREIVNEIEKALVAEEVA